ncbi:MULTISPECIES: hypothetical protein [unclassified Leisingera]|uniref:hypothetical protein n=1 Tax=unclassified Leisingera TaxID=2614906 RepID=UPI0013E98E42|nr:MULTISPECIES: hypothetical protein [unclassified Leisingera]MCF6433179.1 hypothetical protein [Leisingera sp. MMG026]
MAALRFMTWNALLLIRRPFQFVVRVFMFISLGAAVVSVVVIFTGTGNEQIDADAPIWARVAASAIMVASYFAWSGISYLFDSALFKLTPEGRALTLFN